MGAPCLIQLVVADRLSESFRDIVFTCVDESLPISVNKFDQRLNQTLVFQAAVSNRRSRPGARHNKARAEPGFIVFLGCAALAVPRQKSCVSILPNYPRLCFFDTGISKSMAL